MPGFPTVGSTDWPVWDLPYSSSPSMALQQHKVTTAPDQSALLTWIQRPVIPKSLQLSLLLASLPKNTASKILLLHELWASNRNRAVSQQLSHISRPTKSFGRALTYQLHRNQKYYLGASEKHVPPATFLLLTLNLIPRFSPKPFCFAPLQCFMLSGLWF